MGSVHRTTTAFKCKDGKVRIKCGCFYGDVDEFEKQVINTRDRKIEVEYLKFAELIKIYFEINGASSNDESIKVNDIVKITNTGSMYTTNVSWMRENVKDPELQLRYAYGDSLGFDEGITKNDDNFIVKIVGDDRLYIEHSETKKCYLIGIEGVKKC